MVVIVAMLACGTPIGRALGAYEAFVQYVGTLPCDVNVS